MVFFSLLVILCLVGFFIVWLFLIVRVSVDDKVGIWMLSLLIDDRLNVFFCVRLIVVVLCIRRLMGLVVMVICGIMLVFVIVDWWI